MHSLLNLTFSLSLSVGFKSTFQTKKRFAIIMLPFHATWKKVHLYATLALRSVDEIPRCYHSNETSSAVHSRGTIYLVYNSNFWICGCIFSKFYLWTPVQILSKFKVILIVIFRWRKKSEWMFKWWRKCKTSPSSVSMCFHSTLC